VSLIRLKEHFKKAFVMKKRDIIGEMIQDAFGKNRFYLDVGQCETKTESFGSDDFGAKFKAAFCNSAKLRFREIPCHSKKISTI
jgi:hypothetical protein